MTLGDEIKLSEQFLSEFKSEDEDQFGSVVKRIQGMSYEAEFVAEQDELTKNEYLDLFDKLINFAGENHQATDKILPSIARVQENFGNYNPPWKRHLDNKELIL